MSCREKKHPLSRFAPSPSLRRGGVRAAGDTLGAGRHGRHRPFLGVSALWLRQFRRRLHSQPKGFLSCVECAVCCRAPATGARRRPDRPGDASG
ncbi:hypothetical protein F3K36_19900 [Delftia sp. BR1]|nr:hypothetical protein F3K36_19900 [Delftia sp. BR1]